MSALHHDVERIGRSFRVIGMSTPSVVGHKCKLLLTPNRPGEHVVVAAADAVRCSTTVMTLLAAGAAGVIVHRKQGGGPTIEDARRIAELMGVELLTAGELHGQPIPGGVVGNSPIHAARLDLRGKLILFASTNFGAAFQEVAAWAAEFERAGGRATIVVLTFGNTAAVSRKMRALSYDRSAVAVSGFYNTITQEDMVLAGDLLRLLDEDEGALDDEARVMVASSLAAGDGSRRLALLQTNWIGSALGVFGMQNDVKAVLQGDGMPAEIWGRLRQLVPVVHLVNGIPVIRTDWPSARSSMLPGHSTT